MNIVEYVNKPKHKEVVFHMWLSSKDIADAMAYCRNRNGENEYWTWDVEDNIPSKLFNLSDIVIGLSR